MNKLEKPQHPHASHASVPSKRAAWKWVVPVVLVLVMAGIYIFIPPKERPSTAANPFSGKGGKGGFFGRGGVTPVSTAAAAKGELKVFLTSIGTVTATNTATVKSNATGELIKIHFTEGQLVKAGDLLVELDSRQYRISLDQAEGQLARDSASLRNARLDLQRYENAKSVLTQQQVDTAKATVDQLEGTVRADQATVENFKLQLSYCRVTAPIPGRVGLRMVDQGNLIRPADPGIVTITQEQPISVVFSIPEDNLPQVRKALAEGRKLEAEAFDRGMKTRLATGALVALDNQIDPTTGTVRLKALFPNEDHGLFPNQFVNVRMLTEVQENVTLVPNSAIQLNGPARFLFVVKSDETVERRAITVGKTEGERTVVTSGLQPGEVVVTEGLDRLQSGSKVMAKVPVPEAPAGGGGRGEKGGKRGEKGKRGGQKAP